jgi:hypothetical protein
MSLTKYITQNKKGFAGQLTSVVIGLIVVGVVIALGFLIMANTQYQVGTIAGNASAAYNSTTSVISALGTIPAWLPILILIIIAGLIIMYIVGWAGGKGKRGG